MRIVMVHNHYQQQGGEDESFRSEVRVLQEAGHEVVTFTEHNDRVAALGNLRTALRTVWSPESYARVRALLRTQRPDVLHVQNFFPLLSPSVFYASRAEGVPVVHSLRNYRLLCPNALFFRDGHVCEDCLGRAIPWPGVLHGCYRDDRLATAPVAAMIASHRLAATWTRMVDLFVVLTEFARMKFIAGGLSPDKVVVKPNFVHPDPGVGQHRGEYALFVGRLTPEKGIRTLLSAWDRLGWRFPLRIVGDGPLRDDVRQATTQGRALDYLGPLPVHEVYRHMADAKVLILPSEWYETFGRVAVEAFSMGTPVIAANIGAVAELVEHNRTGLHFTPGDAVDLAAAVEWVWNHPGEAMRMGMVARREYEAKYTAERNYEMLMDIYQTAMASARTSQANAGVLHHL